jgi:hypothetical protein
MMHLLYLEEGSAQSLTFWAESKGADVEARQEARLKEHLGSRPEAPAEIQIRRTNRGHYGRGGLECPCEMPGLRQVFMGAFVARRK